MLYELVYVTTAQELLNHDALTALLVQKREYNAAHGISGLMLYIEGNFIELLEGSRDEIISLYTNIYSDEQFRKSKVLYEGPLSERRFADWQMAFSSHPDAQPSQAGELDLKQFTTFIQKVPQQARGIRFLRSFYDLNYR